jgi:dipeptidase
MNQKMLDLIDLRREIDREIRLIQKDCKHVSINSVEMSDHSDIWVGNTCNDCGHHFITKLRRFNPGY